MTVTDELLQNNQRYAERFDKGDLSLPPAKGALPDLRPREQRHHADARKRGRQHRGSDQVDHFGGVAGHRRRVERDALPGSKARVCVILLLSAVTGNS